MPAKTTGWTAAGIAPTVFTAADNWTAEGVAVDGDTIRLDSATAPDTLRPTTGTTFNFQVLSALTPTLDNWLDGAAIGNVTVNHAEANVVAVDTITGTTTVTAGSLDVSGHLDGVVSIAGAGTLQLSAGLTITGAVTNNGYIIIPSTVEVVCNGLFTNNGTLDALTGSSIDFNGGLTGEYGTIGQGGVVTITGSVNLTSATWDVGAGSTLTVDNAGGVTLNLGTASVPNLAVDIQQNTTLAASFACYSFKSTSGTPALTGAGKTITVGAGGLSRGSMTLSAVGVPNATASASTSTFIWDSYSSALGLLTVNTGVTVTASGSVRVQQLAGAGTLAMAGNAFALYSPPANFFTFTGTITSTAAMQIYPAADIANAALIIAPPVGGLHVLANFGANKTLTANGGIAGSAAFAACGPLQVGGSTQPRLAMGTGNLTCTTITLGPTTATATGGTLTLGAGTHTFTTLASGNAANVGNAVTYAGRCNIGGNQTWAGIAVTLAAGTVIKPTAAVKIDCTVTGATSVTNNGADLFSDGGVKLLTIDYIPALATPLRTWCGCVDGGHNTAGQVVFHPGAPSALGLMGCGV